MKKTIKKKIKETMKPLVLMSREQSSMVSTWNELLCLRKLENAKWSIGIYSYDILGSIYDLIPEDQRYDADGDLIIPDEWDGKKVFGLEDGEYLQTDKLVIREEGAEFDASSLHIARDYCREHGWEPHEGFQTAWKQLSALVSAKAQRK